MAQPKPSIPKNVTREILTVQTVAARLGLSVRRVYALIQAGKLPAIKTGSRAVRIPARAFEEYLAQINDAARASVQPVAPAAARSVTLAEVLKSYPPSAPEDFSELVERLGKWLRSPDAEQDADQDAGSLAGIRLYLKNSQ